MVFFRHADSAWIWPTDEGRVVDATPLRQGERDADFPSAMHGLHGDLALQALVAHSPLTARVLPYSHLLPASASSTVHTTTQREEVTLPLSKGDVLFFDPRIHRSTIRSPSNAAAWFNNLQITSALAIPTEKVDNLAIIERVWPILLEYLDIEEEHHGNDEGMRGGFFTGLRDVSSMNGDRGGDAKGRGMGRGKDTPLTRTVDVQCAALTAVLSEGWPVWGVFDRAARAGQEKGPESEQDVIGRALRGRWRTGVLVRRLKEMRRGKGL